MLKTRLIVATVVTLLFASCATTRHKWQVHRKNAHHNKCKRLAHLLARANGNAFFLGNDKSFRSFVWYRSDGKLTIYSIDHQRKTGSRQIEDSSSLDWIKTFKYEDKNETRECMTIHGDYIYFTYQKNDSLIDEYILSDVPCLMGKTFNSQFMTRLVHDLQKYRLQIPHEWRTFNW